MPAGWTKRGRILNPSVTSVWGSSQRKASDTRYSSSLKALPLNSPTLSPKETNCCIELKTCVFPAKRDHVLASSCGRLVISSPGNREAGASGNGLRCGTLGAAAPLSAPCCRCLVEIGAWVRCMMYIYIYRDRYIYIYIYINRLCMYVCIYVHNIYIHTDYIHMFSAHRSPTTVFGLDHDIEDLFGLALDFHVGSKAWVVTCECSSAKRCSCARI